jgi:hypothetical protein
MEQQDREQAEQERIHRLIAFRNKARQELMGKQRSRELLETKAGRGTHGSTRGFKTEQNIFS